MTAFPVSIILLVIFLCYVSSSKAFAIGIPSRLKSLVPPRSKQLSPAKSLTLVRAGHSTSDVFGGPISEVTSKIWNSNTPTEYFNKNFLVLSLAAVAAKYIPQGISVYRQLAAKEKLGDNDQSLETKKSFYSLARVYLPVFWLLRMADWMQGPYFYDVYASKIINGEALTADTIAKLFLTGFVTTGVFGPMVGKFVDNHGRRAGTMLFTLCYAISALSTLSSSLPILYFGRLFGGVGTSLLFSAPESWLVGEHSQRQQQGKGGGDILSNIFSLAYSGDAIVAILAGLVSSQVASLYGPTAPFSFSLLLLSSGAMLTAMSWNENRSTKVSESKPLSIMNAWREIIASPSIISVGLIQALFEGAMYIFVLQWAPILRDAIQNHMSWSSTASSIIPYGVIFSCFMASCLLGSTIASQLRSSAKFTAEQVMSLLLITAATSMFQVLKSLWNTNALSTSSSLGSLSLAFFLFEVTVGMYFPTIGSLRCKYIPETSRSVIMNIFGIPLNLIVVSVFLNIKSWGVQGAMTSSFSALAISVLLSATLLKK